MKIVSEIQKLLAQNKIEEAQRLLEDCKQNLDYDDYHAYYGLSLEMKHQYELATKEYYKIQYVGERISSKFYHLHLAVCLNALEKPKQALAHLIEIEHYLSKKEIPLHFQFYVTYSMLGEEQKAKSHIESICRVSKNPFYHFRYANLLNNLGYFEEAYKIEKKLYKSHSQNPFLIRELSSSSYNMQKYDEAEIYLKKLIELKEGTDWDYIYLANIYIMRNQHLEAIEMLHHIKEMNAHIYIKYAYCYSELGKEKKAISYYEKAITKDPKNIIGIASYSTFYRNRGKYEEAIQVLKRYRKDNPEYESRVYYELAKAESDRGNYKKAIFYLKKGAKFEEHPLIYCDLAWNYKQLDQFEEEEEVLEKAVQWLPTDGWVIFELATCLLQLGKYERALERYLQIDTRNIEIDFTRFFYELGYCYEVLGNLEEAKKAFLEVPEKEEYTCGHLVKCCLQLGEIEEMKLWAEKISFQTQRDPWFLEVYLDYLTGIKAYDEMNAFLVKYRRKLPKLLYLQKQVLVLCKTSQNQNDLKLRKAFKYQKQIQVLEGENADNVLMEGYILNRLNQREDAKICLKKVEKFGKLNRLLKREWVYNYYLSSDLEELEKAYILSKELYQDTKNLEDAFLIVLCEYKRRHYGRALFQIRLLTKKGFSSDTMEIIRGICYYKMGLRSYGMSILNPWMLQENKNDLLREFLKERML